MMTLQKGTIEAYLTTTKMADAIKTVLNELDGIFSLQEEHTTALKAFVEKVDYAFCRPVLRHPLHCYDWM